MRCIGYATHMEKLKMCMYNILLGNLNGRDH
jgi:hypothetical protein